MTAGQVFTLWALAQVIASYLGHSAAIVFMLLTNRWPWERGTL